MINTLIKSSRHNSNCSGNYPKYNRKILYKLCETFYPVKNSGFHFLLFKQ